MANIVTYAISTEDSFTGTVPVDFGGPYAIGSSVAVLGNVGALNIAGQTFIGWHDSAAVGPTIYAPGDVITMDADSILLYAVFAVPPSLSGLLTEALDPNNEPLQQTIKFVAGDDVSVPIVVWNNDLPIPDLGAFTFEATLLVPPPDAVTPEVDQPFTVSVVVGQLTLSLTAAETGALVPGLYTWVLSATDSAGLKRTFIVGFVQVVAPN